MSSLLAASIMNNPHARWQRGSSAGSIINWIFYCSDPSTVLWLGVIALWEKGWFKYLFSPTNNDRGSFSSMCDLKGCPNEAKCLLCTLTPTARKWTLYASWFPRRGGNLNGPRGSTSLGWKRSGAALPYFSLDEVVKSAGVAANLADLRFDTGEGYNRFIDTLQGFYISDSFGWMSKKRVKKKKCIIKLSNREECSVGDSKGINVT